MWHKPSVGGRCTRNTTTTRPSLKILAPQSATTCASTRRRIKESELHDLAFQVPFLVMLQEHGLSSKQTDPTRLFFQNQLEEPWSSHRSALNTLRSGFIVRPLASTKNISGTSALVIEYSASQLSPAFSDALSSPVMRLGALSSMDNAAYWKVCVSENRMTMRCNFVFKGKKNPSTSFGNANFSSYQHAPRA